MLGFQIYGTSRRGSIENVEFKSEIEEVFPLQFSDYEKTKTQISTISNHKYSRIISLIGATYINSNSHDYLSLEDYYKALSMNLNLAHSSLLETLTLSGTFVYMSSRAAVYGSFDAHYAAVKASNTAFLLSARKSCKSSQCVIPIVSSLIESSSMYRGMTSENREVHRQKTGDNLVQIEEIVNLLLKESFLETDPSYKNGIYQIGRDMN
jgi:hypothetical protein